MDNTDFDALLEFLDFSSRSLDAPQFVINDKLPIANKEKAEIGLKENTLLIGVGKTKPKVNESVGHLYCHICKEHRTLNSYWNCHKKNHLRYLFEANHAIDQTGAFSAECTEKMCIEKLVVPITDYSTKFYDSRIIISKIKIKKYKCDICKRCFNRSSVLKRHKFLHTGIEPFKCDFCVFGYFRQLDLIDHYYKVHGLENYVKNRSKKNFICTKQ